MYRSDYLNTMTMKTRSTMIQGQLFINMNADQHNDLSILAFRLVGIKRMLPAVSVLVDEL